ncbi:MAG: FkbM family methyltransferase [Candidatus Gastranaerophilaceae bacterium]
MRLFNNEKVGNARVITIFGIKIKYLEFDLKSICKKNAGNDFLEDLKKAGFKFNKKKTIKIIAKFEKNLSDINNFLYTKLSEEDKKTFISFCLKRHGKINVVKKDDKKYLDGLFEKAYKIYNSRKNTNDPMEIEFNGKKIKYLSNTPAKKVRPNSKQMMFYCYEMVHAFFINEYYKEGFSPKDGQIIFDCGACSGDTALAFNAQYENSKIYSFECDDGAFELLERNIQTNKLQNVYPQKAFLSSSTGEMQIGWETEKTLSIDDFVRENNLTDIGLIKFDIEGAEFEALKGSIETIRKERPVLMVPIYHLDSDLYEIPKFLHNLDIPFKFSLKWTEKRILGVDCVLFVKFA